MRVAIESLLQGGDHDAGEPGFEAAEGPEFPAGPARIELLQLAVGLSSRRRAPPAEREIGEAEDGVDDA